MILRSSYLCCSGVTRGVSSACAASPEREGLPGPSSIGREVHSTSAVDRLVADADRTASASPTPSATSGVV